MQISRFSYKCNVRNIYSSLRMTPPAHFSWNCVFSNTDMVNCQKNKKRRTFFRMIDFAQMFIQFLFSKS